MFVSREELTSPSEALIASEEEEVQDGPGKHSQCNHSI